MAWHYQTHGIGCARSRYRADRFLVADALSNLAVAAGFAVRNLAQRLPHSALESGGLYIERQVQRNPASLQIIGNFRCHLLQSSIIARDLGLAELFSQVALQIVFPLSELNAANSLVGEGDQ